MQMFGYVTNETKIISQEINNYTVIFNVFDLMSQHDKLLPINLIIYNWYCSNCKLLNMNFN